MGFYFLFNPLNRLDDCFGSIKDQSLHSKNWKLHLTGEIYEACNFRKISREIFSHVPQSFWAEILSILLNLVRNLLC